jgi:hypothetical protein
MRVENVHERFLSAPPPHVGSLIDDLASTKPRCHLGLQLRRGPGLCP